MNGHEWRYLPGGTVKHAVPDLTLPQAACGTTAWSAAFWMGTGRQAEYDTIAALPACRRCVAKVGQPEPVERCVPLVDDQVDARLPGEVHDRARQALLDLVAAAHRLQERQDAADPGRVARRDASAARIRERNRRAHGGEP